MSDQVPSVEKAVRPLIEQCRRDIEAAWRQLEAAQENLHRSPAPEKDHKARGRVSARPDEEAGAMPVGADTAADDMRSIIHRMSRSAARMKHRKARRMRRKGCGASSNGHQTQRHTRRPSMAR